jgi:hypothetical protein
MASRAVHAFNCRIQIGNRFGPDFSRVRQMQAGSL